MVEDVGWLLLSNVQVSSQRQLQIFMLHFMGIVVGIHKSLCYIIYLRLLCSAVNNIFCLSIDTDTLQTLFSCCHCFYSCYLAVL
jgi:hypothetical protein